MSNCLDGADKCCDDGTCGDVEPTVIETGAPDAIDGDVYARMQERYDEGYKDGYGVAVQAKEYGSNVIDTGQQFVPIKVFRSNYQGDLLAVFTCPRRCGYGFGNASVGEAAHKALRHMEGCGRV